MTSQSIKKDQAVIRASRAREGSARLKAHVDYIGDLVAQGLVHEIGEDNHFHFHWALPQDYAVDWTYQEQTQTFSINYLRGYRLVEHIEITLAAAQDHVEGNAGGCLAGAAKISHSIRADIMRENELARLRANKDQPLKRGTAQVIVAALQARNFAAAAKRMQVDKRRLAAKRPQAFHHDLYLLDHEIAQCDKARLWLDGCRPRRAEC